MKRDRRIQMWALLAAAGALALAVWGGLYVFRARHFSVRLVSIEFALAKDGASFPGAEYFAGEDSLIVRFESDLNLMQLAAMRDLQFWGAIDGSPIEDSTFGGRIFLDMADLRWRLDIADSVRDAKQYVARVRLWPSEQVLNRRTYYRDRLLRRDYDEMRFQVVGSMMTPGFYYSSELVVPGDDMRRAVADALGR